VSIGEEPDEGKPHVRFCEGHSKSIAPANASDKERFRYVYSTISVFVYRNSYVFPANIVCRIRIDKTLYFKT